MSAAVRRRAAWLAGLGAAFVPCAPGLAAAPAPGTGKVVGTVDAIGGSTKLQVQEADASSPHLLKVGDKLTLGSKILMGGGVTATLSVNRPGGVAADTDLVELANVGATHHKVSLSRSGAKTTITISDPTS